MKKALSLVVLAIIITMTNIGSAEQMKSTMENIKLRQPQFDQNITLYDAFKQRKSARSFSKKQITDQDLSNLLWSAAGINRTNGKRTVPLLGNIAVYVAMDSGEIGRAHV